MRTDRRNFSRRKGGGSKREKYNEAKNLTFALPLVQTGGKGRRVSDAAGKKKEFRDNEQITG